MTDSRVHDPPRVSVIVPVRNRREGIATTLEGLSVQTFTDFEVVVVDDGSIDGSGEVASSWRGLPRVRVVRTEGIGAVRARVAGVEAAEGSVLAFTDSDCIPEEGWLYGGVAAIDKGADVVQGVTIPGARAVPLGRSIRHRGPEGLFATCNVFYRREAYEEAGGFDGSAGARFGFRGGKKGRALGFGEDTLLGWRVARCGRSAIASDAVVRHAVETPPLRELLWRAWQTGGFAELVREAPELRHTLLSQGMFLGHRRQPLYAAMLALLAGGQRRRPLMTAAVCWWAIARGRRVFRLRGARGLKLWAVTVEMAVDVITAIALVWGSARSRTLVL